MENTKSRRGKIRKILYITSIIIVLGIFSIIQTVRANRYEREVLLAQQQALLSLDEYLDNISTNLEKTIYVSTPTMLTKLSTELWRETAGAKNSLSLMSSNDVTLMNTYKFLSQIGEFVMALQRKGANGEELTAEEREQLKELGSYCTSLRDDVSKMCYDLQNGIFSFEETAHYLLEENQDISTVTSSFDDVEQSLSDLPSLIYDGPFSDHIEQGSAKYLIGLDKVTKNEALLKAEKISGSDELRFAYEEDGIIPCYVFQNDSCTIGITKIGGKPLYMISSTFVGEIQIEYEDAVSKAEEYLNEIGYTDLEASYYYTEDGICTINFAATHDNVIYYPDLIKVCVSLENGNILSFDATGYVSNHTDRGQMTRRLTSIEAQNKITGYLEIIDTRPCLIPTDWKTEQYCYEIHCKTSEGQELLVYIDCNTGEEDNILILLYSDGGVLTK